MHDLIIIGAGPAGLTAALYSGRFRMDTLVLEKMSPGGQIILSENIENYPGFPGGITTFELIERFKKQVEELGIKIESAEVSGIKQEKDAYVVKTGDKDYQSRAVIIASGAQPRRLGIAGEERLTGRGVSYCGTCDGPLFKNKNIVLIGGGDRAIEEAIFLAGYAAKVNVVHRRDELRASRILVEKAVGNPGINFILESVVEEISGENKVEAVKIKNVKTNAKRELACAGVFVFAGIKPNTDFLKNTLEISKDGFIITDNKMSTSREGIFACGDCRQKPLYQVITACGEGACAADSAYKYISEAITQHLA